MQTGISSKFDPIKSIASPVAMYLMRPTKIAVAQINNMITVILGRNVLLSVSSELLIGFHVGTTPALIMSFSVVAVEDSISLISKSLGLAKSLRDAFCIYKSPRRI